MLLKLRVFLQLTFEKFSYRQKSIFTRATLIVFLQKSFANITQWVNFIFNQHKLRRKKRKNYKIVIKHY